MPIRKPKIDRKGIIDLETAKNRFNEYYNNRSKSKIARLRAKMFDAKYQKKPRYLLRPGEPGSAKYLLEEGPRSFDMEGVDYFPEGTSVDIDDPEYDNVTIVSSGSTNKRDDTDDPEELEKIYGPRIKNTKRLYSKHFGDKFRGRREEGDLKEKKLIEIYWEKYRNNPERYRRKNKVEKEISIELVQFWIGETPYFLSRDGKIFNSEGENIDNINLEGFLASMKDEVIESLNELDLLEELDDDRFDIDQNAFRNILAQQKIERGEISLEKSSSETSSIISNETSSEEEKSSESSFKFPSPFSSSTIKETSKKTTKEEQKSSDSSFKFPSPFSSSSKKTEKTSKETSKKSSKEIESEEDTSQEESLEISLDEDSDSKKESSEEVSENIEGEEEFEINPGLNEDKSTGKKYYLEVSEDGEELIIYNENRRNKIGIIKIEEADYNKFKELGINATKLVLLDEGSESESEQSGGTYYDEISIDEYELRELEKLAGLR